MSRKIDVTGQRRGKLLAIGEGRNERGEYRIKVQCDCGTIKLVHPYPFSHGKIQTCGCLVTELAKRRTQHGMSKTKTFASWRTMLARITNPNQKDYRYYGGKGITIAPAWYTFTGFLTDMGPCPEGLQLSRIVKTGNFEPGNCVWETRQQSGVRRRTRVRIIAERQRAPYLTIKRLLAQGWTPPPSIAA